MHFKQFACLPIEIRLQIWTATLPGPRYIGPVKAEPRQGFRKKRLPGLEDPIALKINHESREVAMSRYRKRDLDHLRRWKLKDDVIYSAFIDYETDYASFHHFQFFHFHAAQASDADFDLLFFSRQEMGMITRLWLAHENISDLARDICRWIETWLDYFFSLKEIVVEVRNLKLCGGLALGGGVFLTVKEALQHAQFAGREALEQKRLQREGDLCSGGVPVLEVEDVEKLLLEGRIS